MNLQELNLAIIAWADDRQILTHSTAYAQVFKTAEETAELIAAIAKHSTGDVPGHNDYSDEMMDAIGDIYVTLIVGLSCYEDGGKFEASSSAPSLVIMDLAQPKYLCGALSELAREATMGKGAPKDSYIDAVNWFINVLDHFAVGFNSSLESCVNHAYDQIKDRKGYLTAEGIFVKEEV